MLRIIVFLFILSTLLSCSSKVDFIYNKWQLGKETDQAVIEIDEEKGISYLGHDSNYIIKKAPFKITNSQKDFVKVKSKILKDDFPFALKKIAKDHALFIFYKDYIHPERIDEVFYAKKDVNAPNLIKKQAPENIILPSGFKGEFYIVYEEKNVESDAEIRINKKGFGFNSGHPNLLQLYQSNREFLFENNKGKISLLNPNHYLNYYKPKVKITNPNEWVVLKLGFNQSGRKDFNRSFKKNISTNIEFFEIGKIADLAEKYHLDIE